MFKHESSRLGWLLIAHSGFAQFIFSVTLPCLIFFPTPPIRLSVVHASGGRHHHHQVLFPLSEIGPSVLSLQVSRFFAQLLASVHPLNPSSPLSFSTVLLQVSLGRPLLRLPSGVQVKAILVLSVALFLNMCPINFQRLRFIC